MSWSLFCKSNHFAFRNYKRSNDISKKILISTKMEVYLELQEEFNSIQIKDFVIWNPCLLKQTFFRYDSKLFIYDITKTVQSFSQTFMDFTILLFDLVFISYIPLTKILNWKFCTFYIYMCVCVYCSHIYFESLPLKICFKIEILILFKCGRKPSCFLFGYFFYCIER